MRLRLALLAALALLLACSGDQSPGPSPGLTSSPTGPPSPEALATPAPTAPPTPPAAPTGAVLALLHGERNGDLRVYDVESSHPLFDLRLPETEEGFYSGHAAGRTIAVTNGRSVAVIGLDASVREVLTTDPDEYRVNGVAVSPDGVTLAVSLQRSRLVATPGPGDAGDAVVFIEAMSGREGLRVNESGRFEEFIGRFWRLSWLEDGTGVVVHGATYSERPGGLATIFTDGTFEIHDLIDYASVAPSGRLASHGAADYAECLSVASSQLLIRDLDRELDIASVSDAPNGLVAWEWSPDSAQLLLRSHRLSPIRAAGCETVDPATIVWFVLDAASGALTAVDEPGAIYAGWYGDRLLEMRCGDTPGEVFRTRSMTWHAHCPVSSNAAYELLLNGDVIARTESTFDILGFVE